MKNYIKISGNDWWDNPVEMCQTNYCILQEEDDKVIAYFMAENSGVFDKIYFSSRSEAEAELTINRFQRITKKEAFVPDPPFYYMHHPNGKIYSSGRFWKSIYSKKVYADDDPFFCMCGAVIGDIAGSTHEGTYHKTQPENLIEKESHFTDDTVLTCGVANGLLSGLDSVDIQELHNSSALQDSVIKSIAQSVKKFAKEYPCAGYGSSFKRWMLSNDLQPYNSYGNGAAMRVACAGWRAKSLKDAQLFAELSAKITHNHPDAITGASVVAASIFILKTGGSKRDVADYAKHYYDLRFSLDALRPIHAFNITCSGTVPVALAIFFESDCFVEAIKLAISMGGDVDTIAAIAGSIAEAYYQVPEYLQIEAMSKLDTFLLTSFRKATHTLIRENCWNRHTIPYGVRMQDELPPKIIHPWFDNDAANVKGC